MLKTFAKAALAYATVTVALIALACPVALAMIAGGSVAMAVINCHDDYAK